MHTHEKTTVAKPRVLSLYHLVAELLDSYGRVNKERRKNFINAVPSTMVVDSQLTGSILGDLFVIISSNPGREIIHITAAGDSHSVKLHVKESGFLHHCFAGSMAA